MVNMATAMANLFKTLCIVYGRAGELFLYARFDEKQNNTK